LSSMGMPLNLGPVNLALFFFPLLFIFRINMPLGFSALCIKIPRQRTRRDSPRPFPFPVWCLITQFLFHRLFGPPPPALEVHVDDGGASSVLFPVFLISIGLFTSDFLALIPFFSRASYINIGVVHSPFSYPLSCPPPHNCCSSALRTPPLK